MFRKCWLVLVLAVLCGVTAAAPADAPPLPDDLKMIPPDTIGFVAVRGAEIAKTDLVRRMRRELGTDGAIGKELAGHLARELRNAAVEQTGKAAEVVVPVKADGLTEDFENAVVGALTEAVTAVRGSATRVKGQNSLKIIGLAMHNFHDATGGLPAAAICDKAGQPLLSWRVAILPYIEEDALYRQFKLDEPWDSEHNKKLVAKMPKVYALQGAVTPKGAAKRDYARFAAEGQTFYQAFVGAGAAFEPPPAKGVRFAAITDGLSNTVLVGEAADPVVWTKPADLEYAANKPLPKLGGHHVGVFNVLMGDGSVRPLKATIDPKTLRALITRSGTEVIDIDR